MGLTASQRRNRRLAAGALAAAVFAAAALGLGAVLTGGKAEASGTSIPGLVPAGADTLVIAPFSGAWWEKVAPLDDPNKMLAALDPAAADLAIEHIGYSRSQDTEDRGMPFALPLRVFYLESPTEQDAQAVAEWLRYQEAAENRSVFVSGDVVVVGSAVMNAFEAPAESIVSLADYDPAQPEGEATMWMNTGREAVSLTGDGNSANAAAYAGLMEFGFGFETGTKWLGTSTDGASWAGEFTAGGVDPEKIDFEAAVAVLAGTEEVLAEIDGPRGKAEIIEPGVSGILGAASFASGTSHMGELIEASGAASVKDPLITVTNDVTGWNAAVSGIQMAQELVADRNISANAEEMVISLTYRK